MPKITWFFTGVPVVGVLVYWISELHWSFSSATIRIDYHYETGYRLIRAIPMDQ